MVKVTVADLEKRFQMQMKYNGNRPLQINQELDQDLDDLLAQVLENELEEQTLDLIS